MAADDQKSQTALMDGDPVAEYIARQVPYPSIQDTAPRATDQPRLGDMAEAAQPRRWNDPPIITRHPFEVYVVGIPGDGEWPTLGCAWGTIGFLTDATEAISITDLTTTWQAEPNHQIWLEVVFSDDGTITAATLKHGVPASNGWTSYPIMFETVSGGNYWFHPIAHVRSFTPPRSGFNHILTDTGTFYHIAQYERNHLRPVRMCNLAGDNFWMLTPGPGGPPA